MLDLKNSLLLPLLLIGLSLQAQQKLGLEEAVQTALENNQQIQLRRIDADISEMRVDPALVGREPTINLNASYEFGWSDASTETPPLGPGETENTELNLSGVSHDIIVSPELNLLLLDGKASRYRLNKLSAASEVAQLRARQTIEQTVAQVSAAYLQMAQLQSQIDITQQSITLNRERLNRSEQDAAYGTATSLQQLQIEVDLKTDSASLRQLQLNYGNARRKLNKLMGQEVDNSFEVDSAVQVNTGLQLAELERALRQNNTLLKLQANNVAIADLDVKLAEAAYKPTLSGYANLTYTYLRNEASFLVKTRSVGPNVGVRFNYPIYDGGARKIEEQTAIMTQRRRQVEQRDTETELLKELRNAYATYQNALQQLRIERSNLELFQRNLENIQNLYALGQATNTDVRNAQLNLNAARTRVNNYQYTIKQAEVSIYLLTGQLVQ